MPKIFASNCFNKIIGNNVVDCNIGILVRDAIFSSTGSLGKPSDLIIRQNILIGNKTDYSVDGINVDKDFV